MMEQEEFNDLFGSEDGASDIDDGQSASSRGSAESGSPASQPQPQAESEDEESAASQGNDDVDHLFDSEEEEEAPPRRNLKRPAQRPVSEDEDSDEPRDSQRSLDAEDDATAYHQEPKKQRVEIELDMPELPLPMSDDGKYHHAKLPRYLHIEKNPYDPDTLDLGIDTSMKEEEIRQKIENTMRWRRRQDADGIHFLESNTHIVEWEDGKMSLMIGNECFDIHSKSVPLTTPMLLLAHQTHAGALESHVELSDQMTFRPSNLYSAAHRQHIAQMSGQYEKKVKTKRFATTQDPEKAKQELEKQEEERMRMQRKLENQQRRTEERYAMSSRRHRRGNMYDEDDAPMAPSRLDRYEDDFVVEDEEYDDEEEQAREDRLRQVKRRGMDHYRSQSMDVEEDEEEDDEEEEDEEEDEEEEEEVVVRRSRHRHVESDDE